ncbi:MAG: hypothetical protein B6I20_04960 [Bacteroidetes bacterium 4572_117]|nr:MAG: hypothetical protein B6I20_04960 [Bacteroidetes bacterium 4572_117]
MKLFKEDFKTKLYQTIDEIEDSSLVEVVAMIKSQSGRYIDVSFAAGAVFMFLVYTYFMFAPTIYNVYLIYFLSIVSFFIGFSVVEFIAPIKRILTNKKRKQKQVELFARASFQKGGIRHTSEKVGVLIYVSLFEKKVFIIADRGAETALPDEEWKKIKTGFQNIFSTQNIANEFIGQLKNCKTIFSGYIPSTEDDVNELPDNLDVDL